MIPSNVPWMNENNKVNVGVGKVGVALDTISGLSNNLAEITSDVKTQVEAQKELDKQYEERTKEDEKGDKNSKANNEDEEILELEILKAGIKL